MEDLGGGWRPPAPRTSAGHPAAPLPRRTTTIGGIITAIVIGAIIGALARLVLPGRQNISILLTIVVGIVAALIGTFVARALDVSDTPGVDWIELVFQVAVAAVGVTVVGSLTGRRRR